MQYVYFCDVIFIRVIVVKMAGQSNQNNSEHILVKVHLAPKFHLNNFRSFRDLLGVKHENGSFIFSGSTILRMYLFTF